MSDTTPPTTPIDKLPSPGSTLGGSPGQYAGTPESHHVPAHLVTPSPTPHAVVESPVGVLDIAPGGTPSPSSFMTPDAAHVALSDRSTPPPHGAHDTYDVPYFENTARRLVFW